MSAWLKTRPLVLLLLLMPVVSGAGVDSSRQAELRYLLRQDCGSCHGMTLKGGLGPSLLPSALHGKSDALLIDTVLYGRAGTAMPPWEPMLSAEEAAWLINILRKGEADDD